MWTDLHIKQLPAHNDTPPSVAINAATLQPQMQAFVDTVLHGIKVKNTVQGEVLVAKAIYKSMQAKKIREDNT